LVGPHADLDAGAAGHVVAVDLAADAVVLDDVALDHAAGVDRLPHHLARLPLGPRAIALAGGVGALAPRVAVAVVPGPHAVALAVRVRAGRAPVHAIAPRRPRPVEAAAVVVVLVEDQLAALPQLARAGADAVAPRLRDEHRQLRADRAIAVQHAVAPLLDQERH